MENLEKREIKEGRHYPYDAIIVFGGGLHKLGEKYYPTDYRQGDQFGMLGAGIRMAAALELYFQKKAKEFVFTTGVTEKSRSEYGPDVPTEAAVYREKFLRSLDALKKRGDYKEKFKEVEAPDVILEDKSFSTLSNIQEILQIIQNRGWKKVAIVSSDYHMPRVRALYQQALGQHKEILIDIDFRSAEDIVKEAEPGKYDDVIKRAYKSEEARRRVSNEARGLEDIKSGKYAVGEFQLKNEGDQKTDSDQKHRND